MKVKKPSSKYSNISGGTSAMHLLESAPMSIEEIGAFEAKTHLSAILEKVSQGASFYITKHGKRIAEIKPIDDVPKRPIPGLWKGRIWMADDFDAPLEDFKEYME